MKNVLGFEARVTGGSDQTSGGKCRTSPDIATHENAAAAAGGGGGGATGHPIPALQCAGEPPRNHSRTRSMTRSIALSVIALGLGSISDAALAQSRIVWSSNAMACEPAGAPIARDLHDSLAGVVRFKDGQIGNIALICPISQNLGSTMLRSLRITYRDGDGRQGPSSVTAALRRVRRTDGHVATLRNGEVGSNQPTAPNSGPNGWATHQSGAPGQVLNHSLDLANFYYYVQINLRRTDPSVPLAVMGVHLVN